VIKRQLVRGEVVDQYTLIDDLLAMKLCEYFFPGKKGMIEPWKTQRFKRFNFYVLEHLFLVHRLAFLKDVYRVPKTIASTIQEMNSLRNALAHAFFPENLRAYQKKGRPAPRKPVPALYKGEDIFTLAGIRKFTEDASAVYEFLLWQIKRRKRPKKPTLAASLTGPAPPLP
jgi:hypothetical protein